jgi:type II secretion system protein N
VRRLARILIIVAAVLAAALIGGMWYLNRWLKAPETHAHVERELSKALKMPLKFQSLTLSLWGGLHAEGVSVQDGGTQFFDSTSFSAKHRIGPLLSGRFVFKEVAIDSPRFVVVQRPDGSWKLPELPEHLKEKPKPKEDPAKPAAPKPAGTPKPKKKEPDVLVEKVLVTNGQADFYDKDHKPFLSASGLKIALQDVWEDNLMGRVVVSRLVWYGKFGLSDFNAGVSYSKEKGFIVPDFVAKVGGGTVTGGFAHKSEKPPKYSAKLKVTDAEIGKARKDGDVAESELTGMINASIELRGKGNDTKQMSGKATVTLKNGSCREFDLIRDIGTFFRIEDIANFGIPDAQADVEIWNGRLNIKPLTISAPPLGLSATGTAKLDGRMDLQAILSADSKFVANNALIAQQFSEADATGMRSLPFQINGTLTKPKHNLKERLTGTKDKTMQKVIITDAVINAVTEGLEAPPDKRKPAGTRVQP